MLKVIKVKLNIGSKVGLKEDQKWYDVSVFDNSPKIIKDFYSYYPDKPRFRNLQYAKAKA